MTAAGGASGTVVSITKIGDLTGNAGPFAAGKSLWIGAGGVLAEAPAAGDWRQSVGTSTATDRIVVTPEPPARIVASSAPLTPTGQFAAKANVAQAKTLVGDVWLDTPTLVAAMGEIMTAWASTLPTTQPATTGVWWLKNGSPTKS